MAKKKALTPDEFSAQLFEMMENCDNAEDLNDKVLVPFVSALEEVCAARGYVMNIYGEMSNIVFTNTKDAEKIYGMVEDYLDSKAKG